MTLKAFDASHLRAAANYESQISIPVQPKVLPGLNFHELGDVLLVDGTPERLTFRGTYRLLVQDVLAAIDGSRDIAALAAQTGLGRTVVSTVVAGLHAAGAIEDVSVNSESKCGSMIGGDAKAFLHRSIGFTRRNRSWADVESRIVSTPVRVAGRGAAASALVAMLHAYGLSVNTIAGPDQALVGEGGLDVVIADDNSCSHETLTELAPAWRRQNGSTLMVGASDDGFILGPFLDRRFTACYSCQARRAGVVSWRTIEDETEAALLAAMAANEVVALVTKVTRSISLDAVVRFSPDNWSQSQTLPASSSPVCENRCLQEAEGRSD